MKLTPCYKDYLWGGTKLVTDYGKDSTYTVTAESWELACHPNGTCYVSAGQFQGLSLQESLKRMGQQALGTRYRGDGIFPILVKMIDAQQDLSIQVHPSDDSAIEGEQGKAEMWYVVDCDPHAYLYCGFSQSISPEELKQRAEDGTICQVLNRVPIQPDDVFFIRPGTVHAICQGTLIAEVQQNSDTTFRLYDYQRRGADGQLRPLHLDRGVHVTDYTPFLPEDAGHNRYAYFGGMVLRHLFSCDYFETYRADIKERGQLHCGQDSFHHILCLEGSAALYSGKHSYPLQKGDSYFLPAGLGAYEVQGNCKLLISKL